MSTSTLGQEVRAARDVLVADAALVGPALRDALTRAYDDRLAALFAAAVGPAGSPPPAGLALVTVGALGRREPAPASDLDLVLVHDGRRGAQELAELADRLWYPLWDAGLSLDHSVRTVAEAVAVAREDLKAALGLLEVRHLAGDAELASDLLSQTRAAWRATAPRRLEELRASGEERARSSGEVAFLLEPDLKEARGGLRDAQALRALAAAQLVDPPGEAVQAALTVLLDVRGELHRRTAGPGRRVVDRLLMQEQDAVAAALGHPDADALMAAVSGAARAVAFASDAAWRRVARPAPARRLLGRRAPKGPVRRPLADGVVEQDGEVVLARDADPARDPVLVLRLAEAAARHDLPLSPTALERVTAAPDLPVPWPREALDHFVGLLGAGPGTVAVMEALDQAGLLVRLVPEWLHVRSKPQRNSYHRFTVDRHLVETAVAAATRTRRVARPDLLLLGALFHDIGKGLPGDHTEVGMVQCAQIGPRLGLDAHDAAVLVDLVRHHLLLPDVATRRDLDDPLTARSVADAVGSAEVLELLHALTESDSEATGPAAWSPWKQGLITALVRRAGALLQGEPLPAPEPVDAREAVLVAAGEVAVEAGPGPDQVVIVAPDARGLLAVAAGVLSLHQVDVRAATVLTAGSGDRPMAVQRFTVAPRFGALPDWRLVRDDVRQALEGTLPLAERLAAKESAYARPRVAPAAPPTVHLVDDASDSATVVEVRAPDGLGVLHRITTALAGAGLDVRTALVSTLGLDVVDAFYVVDADGSKLHDPSRRAAVRAVVLAALEG